MDRLAELRERRALTLRELAEMSGVAADTINQIELGHRKARPSTLRKLARALDVEVREFFEEPTLSGKAEAPEAGPSLLDRGLDAARKNEDAKRKAMNRIHAREGQPQRVDFHKYQVKPEFIRHGFSDEDFEDVLWPSFEKAVRGERAERIAAKLQERLEELERSQATH